MKSIVDEDVAKVAEFLTSNVPALKLQRVARGLLQLVELIYSEEYFSRVAPEAAPFRAFREAIEPFTSSQCSDARRQRPDATVLPQRDSRATPEHGRSSASPLAVARTPVKLPSRNHNRIDKSQRA